MGVLAGEGQGCLPHQPWLVDGQQMPSASPRWALPCILGRSREGVREGTHLPPRPGFVLWGEILPGVCAIHSAPWLPLGNTHLKIHMCMCRYLKKLFGHSAPSLLSIWLEERWGGR